MQRAPVTRCVGAGDTPPRARAVKQVAPPMSAAARRVGVFRQGGRHARGARGVHRVTRLNTQQPRRRRRGRGASLQERGGKGGIRNRGKVHAPAARVGRAGGRRARPFTTVKEPQAREREARAPLIMSVTTRARASGGLPCLGRSAGCRGRRMRGTSTCPARRL